jgi:hypothetical protein
VSRESGWWGGGGSRGPGWAPVEGGSDSERSRRDSMRGGRRVATAPPPRRPVPRSASPALQQCRAPAYRARAGPPGPSESLTDADEDDLDLAGEGPWAAHQRAEPRPGRQPLEHHLVPPPAARHPEEALGPAAPPPPPARPPEWPTLVSSAARSTAHPSHALDDSAKRPSHAIAAAAPAKGPRGARRNPQRGATTPPHPRAGCLPVTLAATAAAASNRGRRRTWSRRAGGRRR